MKRYSDRICAPEDTLARVSPLLASYGITRVARITHLDRLGIPVWNAIRPNARSIAIAQGKGIGDIDARVSATMEALERAIAEDPTLSIFHSTPRQLSAEGERHDSLDGLIAMGAQPIDADETVPWVAARDLDDGAPVLLPYDALHLDRTRHCRYWQSSDGVASGNSEDEAVLHGLLERIERDAQALWGLKTRADRERHAIDPHSFGDSVIDDLATRILGAGFRMALFDLTTDIGVPVLSCLLVNQERRAEGVRGYVDATQGYGAHPVAARAAIRAITEAAQSRLTLISGTRDDVDPALYRAPLPPTFLDNLAAPQGSWHREDAVAGHETVTDMTAMLLSRLQAVGVGTCYGIRLNPGEPRLAVVRVVVPGLENPPGNRRRPRGRRALAKMMVFR